MPIIEYECLSCGKRFEVLHRRGEALVTSCRSCGARVRRLFSPPGIVYKASGFHTTDYVQAKERKAEKEAEKSGTKQASEKSSS
jgi:putative FmdB family regulatory protein